MISNLAGSLALVTCKEPLRSSIATHLRSLMQAAVQQQHQSGPEIEGMIDQVVSVCSNDNLELGCMLIEKAATEKGLRDIEEALSVPLQVSERSV